MPGSVGVARGGLGAAAAESVGNAGVVDDVPLIVIAVVVVVAPSCSVALGASLTSGVRRFGLKGANPFTKRQSSRHIGHVVLLSIHLAVHASQKAWLHGSNRPVLKAVKQTGHSVPSATVTVSRAESSVRFRPGLASDCSAVSAPSISV